MNIKELKSIELSSFTTMMSGISVMFSIITSVIISALLIAFIPNSAGMVLYLIPTLIVGTFMYSIYNTFTMGLFYNLLARKLKTVAIKIENNQIVKISTTETAMMTAIILTIQAILVYLVSVFVLPIFLTSVMQTLLFAGQQTLAYSIYQFLALISQPATIAMFLFGIFIISFVFTLLGTYIYNFMAKKGRGIVLNLNQKGELTQIDSIDSLKLAIAFAIISGVLSIITGIISLASGGSGTDFISGIIAGLVAGFIEAYLFALFHNFLAPKLGKIKLELIDFKIN